MVVVAGLAACCTRPLGAHRPPPHFGPDAPPPHARGHDRRLPPPPGVDEAIAACADELDLPAPASDVDDERAELSDEQHALLGACLEEAGFPPPPAGPANGWEEPV